MDRRRRDENQPADNSLRAKSLHRALEHQVPKTLTPYEWEQWYAEHGVPRSHRGDEPVRRHSWWQFWKS